MPTDYVSDLLRQTLAAVAPGTALRDGLERILRGRTGALIVMGWDREVEALCTGGFTMDAGFSATRLRELAKMDGAVVIDRDASVIHRAAVHLVPDPGTATDESGTRHRTAQQVARQTAHPVISVSQSMAIIAIYIKGHRHVLETTERIMSKASQAMATLERYRSRLDEVMAALSALEVEDLVTERDVALVVQRSEMVRRISEEIDGYLTELGSDGRLVSLQLEELLSGFGPEHRLVVRDYVAGPNADKRVTAVLSDLRSLDSMQLVDLHLIAGVLGLASGGDTLDAAVSPRGIRLLHKVPRLPTSIIDRLVTHFDGLPRLLLAQVEDLTKVGGVGEQRARIIHEGLSRLAESSVFERYV